MERGLIVDLETTGVDPERDKIIEIGIIEFLYGENLKPIITRTYSGLEDPGHQLTDEIKKITGLTDESLAGQSLDWQCIRQFFGGAALVIAHNCEFDRNFLKQRRELHPLAVHWACSMRHIDWETRGFRTRALNYLAADHGFLNPFAHRALFDCALTFRLVEPYLEELIENSYQREFRILATGAPFDAKDKLKRRQYAWDASERVWHKNVLEKKLPEERDFLAKEVYVGKDLHQEIFCG